MWTQQRGTRPQKLSAPGDTATSTTSKVDGNTWASLSALTRRSLLLQAVDAQPHPELERPQARVTLRGVVELVSPDEERRVRKEWLKRGYLAKEDEVHEVAASLLEELARQEEREEEGEDGDEEAAQAARERADAALEQLRRDLQRPETRERLALLCIVAECV